MDQSQRDSLKNSPGWKVFRAKWDERYNAALGELMTLDPLSVEGQNRIICAQQIVLDYQFCFGAGDVPGQWEVEIPPAGEHAITYNLDNEVPNGQQREEDDED